MNGKSTGKIIFLSALMLLVAALPGCGDKDNAQPTTTQTTIPLITDEVISTTATEASTTAAATQAVTTQAQAAILVTAAPTSATAKPTVPNVERVTQKPTTVKATTTAAPETTITVPPVPLKKITELEDVKLETLRYGLMKETHIIVTYTLYSDGSHVDETKSEEIKYNRTNFDIKHNDLVKFAAIDKLNHKADINETVELVNDYRRGYKQSGSNAGLSLLAYDDDLTLAACMRAEEIAYSGKFLHERPDGSPPQTVLDDIGYEYVYMGENLGKGYANAEDAFQAWINSPVHKQNIVNADFTKIGVGYAVDPDGNIFWVQLFAK